MRVPRDLEGNESSETNEEEEQEILNYLRSTRDHFGSWQTRSNQDSGSFFFFFFFNIYTACTIYTVCTINTLCKLMFTGGQCYLSSWICWAATTGPK